MDSAFNTVSWTFDSNIYEVNLRQYTKEGTFRAFATHLPRLREMGIETLWFMPVTPIGLQGRLGTLGSYYACSHYTTTNPEYGSLEDFKWLVEQAHNQGFKVLIDWVANHTAWDHEWTKTHPEFYRKNHEGNFYDAHGWADVIDLNFDEPELRAAMKSAMKFWIEQADIDGFRCDMAMLVPLEFWREARTELDKIKSLLWLAECEEIMYHEVFDISYTWKFLHSMEDYWKKNTDLQGLHQVLYYHHHQFPSGALRAFFTTNHDENSHSGSEYERMGDAAIPFAVFCCLYEGLPLIYSGQELPNKKRLKFFDKDEIEWQTGIELSGFYKNLLTLRKKNPALNAQHPETAPQAVSNTAPDQVMSFTRVYHKHEVFVVINFSSDDQYFHVHDHKISGIYQNLVTPAEPFTAGRPLAVKAWDYRVFVK